jgi:DNA-binding NarL/FixJ family response regulator
MTIDAATLRHTAEQLRLQARKFEDEAKAIDRKNNRASNAEKKMLDIAATANMVERLIATGTSKADAIRATAQASSYPEKTISAHFERRAVFKLKAGREARNLEIMRLARRGWTNADIAARTGLQNASSVSRIIQTALKAQPAPPRRS